MVTPEGSSASASEAGSRGRKSNAAFTLIELLVVITIIGILAALLLPVLSKSKQTTQGTFCLNNGRQMMTALTMYVGDNRDLFPPNPDDGNTIPGHNWCSGQAGVDGDDEFNPDLLKDQTRCLVAVYLAGNTMVFHCPGDLRVGVYQGTDPALLNKTVPAARTFSMSQSVGTICPGYDEMERHQDPPSNHFNAPSLPVNGPWLNNQRSHLRDSPWATYGKSSSIRAPGPSMLWVLVDEGVNGLNDAAFAFGMQEAEWIDMPGTYHNGGCGFAFADGHSESHHWRSTAEKIKGNVASEDDYQDWLWMWSRTSANVSATSTPPLSPF